MGDSKINYFIKTIILKKSTKYNRYTAYEEPREGGRATTPSGRLQEIQISSFACYVRTRVGQSENEVHF